MIRPFLPRHANPFPSPGLGYYNHPVAMMTTTQMAGLGSFVLTLAAGQLMFKWVAGRVPPISGLAGLQPLALHPLFWAALALYGAATLLWVYLLQQIPLSRAYPFVALTFAIVPIGAAVLFGDKLTPRFLVGTAFILVGVYLSGLAKQ
jgi:drug/metabolite transporter (DMT)-like permease